MNRSQNWSRATVRRMNMTALPVITVVASFFGISTATASATASPAPISAACKAIYTSVIKADRLYISLQFDVVSAAKAYVASNSLTNRLVYNNSYIKAIQAGNAELNIAIKSPGCYSAKNISSYKANVKTNLSEIATIFAANVNGQIVGDPKKMATFKPVGLLK